jgi:hypothetical protein
MTDRLESYTRGQVTPRGFEARGVADDPDYLWHRGYGLRIDPRDRATTLITDPSVLPEGPLVGYRVRGRGVARPDAARTYLTLCPSNSATAAGPAPRETRALHLPSGVTPRRDPSILPARVLSCANLFRGTSICPC